MIHATKRLLIAWIAIGWIGWTSGWLYSQDPELLLAKFLEHSRQVRRCYAVSWMLQQNQSFPDTEPITHHYFSRIIVRNNIQRREITGFRITPPLDGQSTYGPWSELRIDDAYFGAGQRQSFPKSTIPLDYQLDPFGLIVTDPFVWLLGGRDLDGNRAASDLYLETIFEGSRFCFGSTPSTGISGAWLSNNRRTVYVVQFEDTDHGLPTRVQSFVSEDGPIPMNTVINYESLGNLLEGFTTNIRWKSLPDSHGMVPQTIELRRTQSVPDGKLDFRLTIAFVDWQVGSVDDAMIDLDRYTTHEINRAEIKRLQESISELVLRDSGSR